MKMNAVAGSDTQYDFSEIARTSISESNGDVENAVKWMTDYILSDKAMTESHIATFVFYFCSKKVRQEILNTRNDLLGIGKKAGASANPTPPSLRLVSALNEAADDAAKRFMDMPIWGGQLIGSATVEQVRTSAEKFTLQATTMFRHAKWQFAVATCAEENGASANEQIRSALTEKKLTQLWSEANAA